MAIDLNKYKLKANLDKYKIVQPVQNVNAGPIPKGIEGDTGFIGKSADALQQRGENLRKTIEAYGQGKATVGQLALNVAGQGVGYGTDILGNALSSIIPRPLKQLGSKAVQGFMSIPAAPTAQGQSQNIGQFLGSQVQKFSEFEQRQPQQGRDIRSLTNIATILPIEKLFTGAGTAAKNAIGLRGTAGLDGGGGGRGLLNALQEGVSEKSAAGAFGLRETVRESTEQKAINNALKVVAEPVTTPSQKEAAIRAGRVFKDGAFEPTVYDQELAKTTAGLVSPKNGASQNVNILKNEIKTSAQGVRAVLKKNPSIFNDNQLRTVLEGAKTKSNLAPIFARDVNAAKAYESVIDGFFNTLKNYKNNLEGLYDARIKFDSNMEAVLGPKLFEEDAAKTAQREAIRNIRTAINEYIGSKVPGGQALKDVLWRQHMLYDSIDNIAASGAKNIDKTLVDKLVDTVHRNPVLSTLAGVGALHTGSTIYKIILNPVALTSLMAYGTYKLGQRVITSDSLKTMLADFLQGLSKITEIRNPAIKAQIEQDKLAVKQFIDTLSKKDVNIGLRLKDVSGMVERMTKTLDDLRSVGRKGDAIKLQEIIQRYETSGLSPEDINILHSLGIRI